MLLKERTNDDAVRSLIENQPLSYEEDFRNGDEFSVTLQHGWSSLDREGLLNEALGYCDPGGQVSWEDEADYDQDRARELLVRTGWVDVDDFIEEYASEDYGRMENRRNSGGHNEIGWNVDFRYKMPVKPLVDAKKVVDIMLGTQSGSDGASDEVLNIRNVLHCILFANADRDTMKLTRMKYKYRHTAFPVQVVVTKCTSNLKLWMGKRLN